MVANAGERNYRDYARELGLTLHRLRNEQDLSQERLAVAAGITGFTLRKLEAGVSNEDSPANPRLRTLVAIAEVLNVDVADLLPNWRPHDVALGR